jgi:hypothetical protein
MIFFVFFEHCHKKDVNPKLLLYLFEVMSGLKINFSKSEVLVICGDNNVAKLYAGMFS